MNQNKMLIAALVYILITPMLSAQEDVEKTIWQLEELERMS